MDPTGRGQTAFVELANQADHASARPDAADRRRRARSTSARSTSRPATRVRLSIPLPVDARHLSLRLLGHDALALDDTGRRRSRRAARRAMCWCSAARRTVCGGRSNRSPSLHVRTADPAPRRRARSTESDRARWQPARPASAAGPLLLVDPPSNSARLLGVGLGSGARVRARRIRCCRAWIWRRCRTKRRRSAAFPAGRTSCSGTLQGPLIMEGRLEGRPAVALTFDPAGVGPRKVAGVPAAGQQRHVVPAGPGRQQRGQRARRRAVRLGRIGHRAATRARVLVGLPQTDARARPRHQRTLAVARGRLPGGAGRRVARVCEARMIDQALLSPAVAELHGAARAVAAGRRRAAGAASPPGRACA